MTDSVSEEDVLSTIIKEDKIVVETAGDGGHRAPPL